MKKKFCLLNASFFAGMGIVALVKPSMVVNTFGLKYIDADMRNEVRAVYGGFGLTVASLLVASNHYPQIEKGIKLTIAASLLGMASGRVISFLIEKPQTQAPLLFCALETVLAGTLIYSINDEN
ncbi:MAG: DUF4345 domain-containing protein [Acinetobacter sp.]